MISSVETAPNSLNLSGLWTSQRTNAGGQLESTTVQKILFFNRFESSGFCGLVPCVSTRSLGRRRESYPRILVAIHPKSLS